MFVRSKVSIDWDGARKELLLVTEKYQYHDNNIARILYDIFIQ